MEIAVMRFIHILDFILEYLKIIISYNLLLARIIEQEAEIFLVAGFGVEELRLRRRINVPTLWVGFVF